MIQYLKSNGDANFVGRCTYQPSHNSDDSKNRIGLVKLPDSQTNNVVCISKRAVKELVSTSTRTPSLSTAPAFIDLCQSDEVNSDALREVMHPENPALTRSTGSSGSQQLRNTPLYISVATSATKRACPQNPSLKMDFTVDGCSQNSENSFRSVYHDSAL